VVRISKNILCDYGCGRESLYFFNNGKMCCSDHYSKCPESSTKNSKSKMGIKHGVSHRKNKSLVEEYGALRAEEIRTKISLGTTEGMKKSGASEKLSLARKGKSYEELEGEEAAKEHRRKSSEARKGEKSHFWQGGISKEVYGFEFNEDLKEYIRNLNNRFCTVCDRSESEFPERLSVHHMDSNKKNNEWDNLMPLCRSCHMRISRSQIRFLYNHQVLK